MIALMTLEVGPEELELDWKKLWLVDELLGGLGSLLDGKNDELLPWPPGVGRRTLDPRMLKGGCSR